MIFFNLINIMISFPTDVLIEPDADMSPKHNRLYRYNSTQRAARTWPAWEGATASVVSVGEAT